MNKCPKCGKEIKGDKVFRLHTIRCNSLPAVEDEDINEEGSGAPLPVDGDNLLPVVDPYVLPAIEDMNKEEIKAKLKELEVIFNAQDNKESLYTLLETTLQNLDKE